MGRVITFMNQKGGVAKTTSSVTMAYCLEERGYSVLFIDLDSQANASKLLLSTQKYNEIAENNIVTLINGESSFEETVQQASPLIDVIPSELVLKEEELRWQQKIAREFLLKKAISPAKDRYDFIIIDTPPQLMLNALNAIVATDDIIIPYKAESFSLDGVRSVYDAIQPIRANGINDNVCIFGLLLTQYEMTRINSFIIENIEMLAKSLGVKHLFKTMIRKTTKIPECITEEYSLLEYAPDCTAAIDYRNFTAEYLEANGYSLKKEES